MKVSTLIEFLDAAADTKYVNGPFDERGGVMIVGPPGSFKTTIIESALNDHIDAITCSDLNVQQWNKMRYDFVSKRYTTLGFPEFEKLYQRHQSTASNLIGTFKALVSEGFGHGPGGDHRTPRLKARCLIVGGITVDCFDRRLTEWQNDGFARRFLWVLISVQNPEKVIEAIHAWEKIDFGRISIKPANRSIGMNVTEEQSRYLVRIMKSQPGLYGTGLVLIKKIAAVLNWKYAKNPERVAEIFKEIAPALSREGGEIIL